MVTTQTDWNSLPLELQQKILQYALHIPKIQGRLEEHREILTSAAFQDAMTSIDSSLDTLSALIKVRPLRPALFFVVRQLSKTVGTLEYNRWLVKDAPTIDPETGLVLHSGRRGSLRLMEWRGYSTRPYIRVVKPFVDGFVVGLEHEARGRRWKTFDGRWKYQWRKFLRRKMA